MVREAATSEHASLIRSRAGTPTALRRKAAAATARKAACRPVPGAWGSGGLGPPGQHCGPLAKLIKDQRAWFARRRPASMRRRIGCLCRVARALLGEIVGLLLEEVAGLFLGQRFEAVALDVFWVGEADRAQVLRR